MTTHCNRWVGELKRGNAEEGIVTNGESWGCCSGLISAIWGHYWSLLYSCTSSQLSSEEVLCLDLPSFLFSCRLHVSLSQSLFLPLARLSSLCPPLPFHVLMWSKSCMCFNAKKGEVCPLENLSEPLHLPAKTPSSLPIQLTSPHLREPTEGLMIWC